MHRSTEYIDGNLPLARVNNRIEDVYERHVDTVYRVCFSMMRNQQDDEDAVQSVFVKYVESKKSYMDIEHEKAWLIVTARNVCIDIHRKWWRKKVVDYDLESVGWIEKDPFKYQDLEERLRKLPPTHKLIVYLYYYEGYKIAEIGNMLNMNVNTIKTRMRDARKRLKLEIGGSYDE